MFYLFPLFPSWEGLGVGSCSLFPAPCSLFPVPCSLFPTSARSLLNCVSTPLRTDLCPPALSKPDLFLFGLGANDDSSLERFVSSPRQFCCCKTTASNSLF
ncbi:MAG: hypothetical protein F6J94_23635 [Moorea sp. SIO1F2]|uniref:hypothetical protein n=1 Tax=Moorena sp. SIO1F2 TaxID=2607819 RepID=UPI0013B5CEC3|nr:hypothetical protein [Moorena sp. SIO1F2]NET84797.1 hypothetical protein [Moorena sp. SIO1F2]